MVLVLVPRSRVTWPLEHGIGVPKGFAIVRVGVRRIVRMHPMSWTTVIYLFIYPHGTGTRPGTQHARYIGPGRNRGQNRNPKFSHALQAPRGHSRRPRRADGALDRSGRRRPQDQRARWQSESSSPEPVDTPQSKTLNHGLTWEVRPTLGVSRAWKLPQSGGLLASGLTLPLRSAAPPGPAPRRPGVRGPPRSSAG
jgi:hypothetical protein